MTRRKYVDVDVVGVDDLESGRFRRLDDATTAATTAAMTASVPSPSPSPTTA